MSFQVHVLARPNVRYKALAIDGIIIGLLIAPVFVFSYIERLYQNEEFLLIFYLFLYKVAVYVVFDVLIPYVNNGHTVGRNVQHIRLVQANGAPAKLPHYLRRALLFVLIGSIGDVLLLGWLAYLLFSLITVSSIILLYTDHHRRTILDVLGGTMVVCDTIIMEVEED